MNDKKIFLSLFIILISDLKTVRMIKFSFDNFKMAPYQTKEEMCSLNSIQMESERLETKEHGPIGFEMPLCSRDTSSWWFECYSWLIFFPNKSPSGS
jgi:hypothetical protein